jgi:hypothetical protein
MHGSVPARHFRLPMPRLGVQWDDGRRRNRTCGVRTSRTADSRRIERQALRQLSRRRRQAGKRANADTITGIVFAIDYGPLSEWFAGAGTFAAVGTALVFSVRGDRRSEDARLRAVYAWCERQQTSRSAAEWLVFVNNQTQFPINEWQVLLSWINPSNSEVARESIDHGMSGVLPPGRHSFPWTPSSDPPATDAQVSVTLSFTDGSGQRVSRTRDSRRPWAVRRTHPTRFSDGSDT